MDGGKDPLDDLSNSQNLDLGVSQPKSFKDIVVGVRDNIPKGAKFEVERAKCGECKDGKEKGKHLPHYPKRDTLIANKTLQNAISLEDNKLIKSAIFFATVDANKIPTRTYMDEWFNNVWNKK